MTESCYRGVAPHLSKDVFGCDDRMHEVFWLIVAYFLPSGAHESEFQLRSRTHKKKARATTSLNLRQAINHRKINATGVDFGHGDVERRAKSARASPSYFC